MKDSVRGAVLVVLGISLFLFAWVAWHEFGYARDHPNAYGPANVIGVAGIAGALVALSLIAVVTTLRKAEGRLDHMEMHVRNLPSTRAEPVAQSPRPRSGWSQRLRLALAPVLIGMGIAGAYWIAGFREHLVHTTWCRKHPDWSRAQCEAAAAASYRAELNAAKASGDPVAVMFVGPRPAPPRGKRINRRWSPSWDVPLAILIGSLATGGAAFTVYPVVGARRATLVE